MKLYLYEGLNKQDRHSMMLWESAGRKLVEAQLTADQITQLFQQIQTAKGNRTLIGKGVDAGSAVMQAYNDLKTKIQNSGPIKNIDAVYDQAAEKLKQATGGDQGVMQYVQKYRDFAKAHPIAQSFIYGALIAAAGISGAGAGGAAALGLFKMVDKLLQGEKFSSAAYQGAKTGAMAYAAGQIGKALKGGDQAQQTAGALDPDAQNIADQAKELTQEWDPSKYSYVDNGTQINIIDKATGQSAGSFDVDMATADEVIAQAGKVGKMASGAVDTATNVAGNVNSMTVSKNAYNIFADKVASGAVTDHNSYVRALQDSLTQAGGDQLKSASYRGAQQSLEMAIKGAATKAAGGEFSGDNTQMLAQIIKTFGGKVDSAALAKDAAATAAFRSNQTFESQQLSNAKVLALFERVARLNNRMITEGRLQEGIWDDIKSGAKKAVGAVAQGAAKVGRSMTANVSSDALTKAWQAAGSPTDSAAVEQILRQAGVNPEVIKTVFQANSIPLSVAAGASTGSVGVDPNEPMPDVMSTNRAPAQQTAAPAQQAPTATAQQTAAPVQQTQPAAVPTASRLPDVSKLTPGQKTALIQRIDQRLAELGTKARAAKPTGPVAAQPTAQKISAPANPGAPTAAEQAKLQQKVQAAMAAQQQP